MLSVKLDRTSLGLEPLVISSDDYADGPLYLTEKDCGWPTFTMRRTYAPDTEAVAGKQLEAIAPEQGSIPLGFAATGANLAAVYAAMQELEAATTQFDYDLTLEVDGVTVGTYRAHAEYPNWGALDSASIRAKRQEGTITIPINPAGSV